MSSHRQRRTRQGEVESAVGFGRQQLAVIKHAAALAADHVLRLCQRPHLHLQLRKLFVCKCRGERSGAERRGGPYACPAPEAIARAPSGAVPTLDSRPLAERSEGGPARRTLWLHAQSRVSRRRRDGAASEVRCSRRNRGGPPLTVRVRIFSLRVRVFALRLRVFALRVRIFAIRVRIFAIRVRVFAPALPAGARRIGRL